MQASEEGSAGEDQKHEHCFLLFCFDRCYLMRKLSCMVMFLINLTNVSDDYV